MRRRIRLWIVVAVINVVAFAVLGIREHVASTSSATRRSSPVESFACVPLERTAISSAEREWYSYIAGECRPPVVERLLILSNVGAFLFAAGLIKIAEHLGATNQVVVFYSAMPILMFAWWYLLGALTRLTIQHRRLRTNAAINQSSTS